MANLKLITTENFGDLECNFYRNMNDDILLTREQIGTALEYSDAQKAIDNIHAKHRDRLDELSITIPIISNNKTPQSYQTMLYTLEGSLMICSLSSQAKAYDFSQWLINLSNSDKDIKVINTRKEIQFHSLLADFLDGLNIKFVHQFKYDDYRIDWYLPELHIAIEYDENCHSHYPVEEEKSREEYLTEQNRTEQLTCKFIRVDDKHSCGENLSYITRQIFNLENKQLS